MNMPNLNVLAVTHGEDVGPELLFDVAAADGHRVIEWNVAKGGAPRSTHRVDAVIVFGGHQNIGEETQHPWLEDEYVALRRWVRERMPLLGICLGAQALARAFGAPVTRLETPLSGFHPTELTDAGVDDPLLGALPRRFECFNGNAFSFDIPEGATLLATGPCPQAFRLGSCAWGVQFHPELKRPSALSWFAHDSYFAGKIGQIAAELEAKLPSWRPLGVDLFRRFLGFAASSPFPAQNP